MKYQSVKITQRRKMLRGETRRHRNGNVILHVSREVIKKKLLSLEAMNVKTQMAKKCGGLKVEHT